MEKKPSENTKRQRDVRCPACRRMFTTSLEIPDNLPKIERGERTSTVIPSDLMTELTCVHCGHAFQKQLVDVVAGF